MTMQLCKRDSDADDTVRGDLAEEMQRSAYCAGWLWGVVCGFVAGGSFVGLAIWLISLVSAAIICPTGAPHC